MFPSRLLTAADKQKPQPCLHSHVASGRHNIHNTIPLVEVSEELTLPGVARVQLGQLRGLAESRLWSLRPAVVGEHSDAEGRHHQPIG